MKENAIGRVEESVQLLRRCSASDLVTYLLGAGPFLIALLLFIEDASRPSVGRVPLAVGALAVALLFYYAGWIVSRFPAQVHTEERVR